ncbi:J domain-containing protein [Salinigranum salinum]|uniref:J domain-containing protein n=1 Tax=Salinigranum salinum TaxID=1364937 RepID=UPI001260C2DA|nr:J domain-containing protein [Salinigranum salinum]
MDRDRLVLGLAAVFAGLTVLLFVLSFAFKQLFLLVVAVPFGATTYLMWYQASGRLEERTRTRRVRGGTRFGPRAGPDEPGGPGGFGADARGGFGAGAREARDRRRATVGPAASGLSQTEAYRALGLDPGADEDAVRDAYRERVKEVHPDRPSGDEDEFKRVNRAYERLTDEPT